MNKGVAFYLGSWVGLLQGIAVTKLTTAPVVATILGALSIVGSVLFYMWEKKTKEKK